MHYFPSFFLIFLTFQACEAYNNNFRQKYQNSLHITTIWCIIKVS
nr:MAG TPA: hypothetical protein [Bacteriophage sp.]